MRDQIAKKLHVEHADETLLVSGQNLNEKNHTHAPLRIKYAKKAIVKITDP